MLLKKYWALLPLAMLCSCANSENNGNYASMPAPAIEKNVSLTDSSEVSADIASPSRKIIRTADFRCRVQNVFTAANLLEHLVKSMGGIVQESSLENTASDTRTMNYKPDSLKQVQIYQTTASLTLRVPVLMLDSVCQTIPRISAFLNERVLKQDDVTLRYLSNTLKNETSKNDYTGRALKTATKTKDVLEVGRYENETKEQTISRHIENMQMQEDVKYATLNVILTQPDQVDEHIIVNSDYFTKPPFKIRLTSAFSNGWEHCKDLFVVIIFAWPYWLLIMLIAFFLRSWFRKRLYFIKNRQ
jgi:hypothetical protein